MLTEIASASELRERIEAFLTDSLEKERNGEGGPDTEKHDMLQLLTVLAGSDVVGYPVTLIKRERPDFCLITSNRQIGVEHTRSVSENEAHKDALRKKGHGPDTWFISPVPLEERRKSKKELVAEIQQDDPGDGWDGDSPEIQWAEAMLSSAKDKLASIKKAGFQRFEEDWLLIRDQWSLPAPDIRKAGMLLANATDLPALLREFKRIFVLSGRFVCDVSTEGVRFHHTENEGQSQQGAETNR